MTGRSVSFVLGRPKVLIPGFIGLVLLVGNVSTFWGVALLVYAVIKASRIFAHADLDDRLRLRADKYRHRIGRHLTRGEQREILAIDDYTKQLRGAGAEATLARELLDQAWEIVHKAGCGDAAVALRTFRQKLPVVNERETDEQETVAKRIARELEIIHATQKEMESLG